MNDWVSCKFVNLYNDQHEEMFFNDLSNMEEVLLRLNSLMKFQAISYEPVNADSKFCKLVMVNELNRSVDFIVFFEFDDAASVIALVAFSLNRIKNPEFIYSVGYCVEKKWRGNGVASRLVAESISHFKSLLNEIGPNLDFGPDRSFEYTLESVVSQKNEFSNKLAKKLLHSGGLVITGPEHRSKEMSNVYKLFL